MTIVVQRDCLSLSLARSDQCFLQENPAREFVLGQVLRNIQPTIMRKYSINGSRMLKDRRYGSKELNPVS